jgi:hypothetical protein
MRLVERLLAPLLFFFVAACALYLSIYEPFLNPDMVYYIAAAKSFEERDLESLHSFTYNELRNSVPDAVYQDLTQAGGRHVRSTDPYAFKEIMPFYQIRPVYTGLIYLFYKTGINIVFATHVISGIAVVVAVAFLYLMSVSFLVKPLIYAVPPLALIFNVLDLAKYSTPDALAFLAVILSAYLYLKKRIALLLILLPIMLGIRTDLILFTIPLLLFFVFERSTRWKAALLIFISVAIYHSIGAYWENPGWSTIFYITLVLVPGVASPISMIPTLTASVYFYALFRGTSRLVFNESFILYILVAASSLYVIKNHAKTTSVVIAFKSSSAVLAVVCLVFVVSHFLAFPVAWDRFFSAPYLLGAFSLLVMMTDYLKASNSTQQGAAPDGDSVTFHRRG